MSFWLIWILIVAIIRIRKYVDYVVRWNYVHAKWKSRNISSIVFGFTWPRMEPMASPYQRWVGRGDRIQSKSTLLCVTNTGFIELLSSNLFSVAGIMLSTDWKNFKFRRKLKTSSQSPYESEAWFECLAQQSCSQINQKWNSTCGLFGLEDSRWDRC